jgi:DNA-binding transcriptional MerR regulator
MEYTTLTLAKEAGISPRTLRYYAQIGLLTPKIRMMNGRCLYGIKEIVTLLHILTLKDFGFSLEKIKSILNEGGRYKICALKAQKTVLLKQQTRLNKNLELIEFMIEKSKEENKMDADEVKMPNPLEALKPKYECVQCFDESYIKEKMAISFEVFRKETGYEYYDSLKKKSNQMGFQDAQIYGGRIAQFLKKIQEAIDRQWPVDSKEVQQVIANQWEALKMVYPDTASKRVYLAIRDQICHNSISQGDPVSARLFHYISEAMGIFAENSFSEE